MLSRSQDLSTPVNIPTGHVVLAGDLSIPSAPGGVVVFAHGSGSSRLSPRNRAVAISLVRSGFATLLFDLLTHDEEAAERHTRHLRFDVALLAHRLIDTIAWLERHERTSTLPVGLFGASTGAAAALIAATRMRSVGAVVSRGGRPDLAADVLPEVRCPTLLIVGNADPEVLALNRRALARLEVPARLHVVDGATHLFEEPGALHEVIEVAGAWFREHLVPGP